MEGGITSPGKLGNVRHPGWDKVSNSKCDQTVWPPAVPGSLSPVIFVFPSPRYSSPIWLSQNITFPEKGWPVLLTPFCVFIQMQLTLFLSINCCSEMPEDICKFYWYWYSLCWPCWAHGISHSEWEVENQVKMEMMIFREPGRLPGQSGAEVLHSDTSRHRTLLHRDKPFVGHSEITIVTNTITDTKINMIVWCKYKDCTLSLYTILGVNTPKKGANVDRHQGENEVTGAAEATHQHNAQQTAKSIVCRFIHLLPRMHAFDALQKSNII